MKMLIAKVEEPKNKTFKYLGKSHLWGIFERGTNVDFPLGGKTV